MRKLAENVVKTTVMDALKELMTAAVAVVQRSNVPVKRLRARLRRAVACLWRVGPDERLHVSACSVSVRISRPRNSYRMQCSAHCVADSISI